MSNTLGPLPPPNVPADCELSDDFCAYDDWYSAEQMEAERLRCYELGVKQERGRCLLWIIIDGDPDGGAAYAIREGKPI